MSLGLVFDLPGAAVALYKVVRQDRELADWVRLVLSCAFSGFVAFSGVTGISLVSKSTPPIAIGTGLIACAVSVITVLLRMKQGRSLMLAMPTEVEQKYETAGQSITEPSK